MEKQVWLKENIPSNFIKLYSPHTCQTLSRNILENTYNILFQDNSHPVLTLCYVPIQLDRYISVPTFCARCTWDISRYLTYPLPYFRYITIEHNRIQSKLQRSPSKNDMFSTG